MVQNLIDYSSAQQLDIALARKVRFYTSYWRIFCYLFLSYRFNLFSQLGDCWHHQLRALPVVEGLQFFKDDGFCFADQSFTFRQITADDFTQVVCDKKFDAINGGDFRIDGAGHRYIDDYLPGRFFMAFFEQGVFGQNILAGASGDNNQIALGGQGNSFFVGKSSLDALRIVELVLQKGLDA